MPEVANEKPKSIMQAFEEFSGRHSSIEELKSMLANLKQSYQADEIEDPKKLIHLIIVLLQSHSISDIPKLLAKDGNHYIKDKGLGANTSAETLVYAENITLEPHEVIITCLNGFSRSKTLYDTLIRNMGVDRKKFVKVSEDADSGYTGIPILAAHMARRLKTATLFDDFNLILFTNSDGIEVIQLLEKLEQYLGDLIPLDKFIDILNGDFSIFGLHEIYIIEKAG